MARTPPGTLWEALGRFQLREVLRLDLMAGVLGGVGAGLLAAFSPESLAATAPLAVGIVGVIIGAVLAGAAILASFLDQAFLRKLRAIGREPVHYLAPFLFTSTLGVAACLFTLLLVALPESTPAGFFVTAAAAAGFLVVWTIASVIFDLDMLVQFIGLQVDAAEVPEGAPLPSLHPKRSTEPGR